MTKNGKLDRTSLSTKRKAFASNTKLLKKEYCYSGYNKTSDYIGLLVACEIKRPDPKRKHSTKETM